MAKTASDFDMAFGKLHEIADSSLPTEPLFRERDAVATIAEIEGLQSLIEHLNQANDKLHALLVDCAIRAVIAEHGTESESIALLQKVAELWQNR